MGFLGGFVGSPRDFWGCWFLPPVTWNSGGHKKFVLYAFNLHISHINNPCSPPPPPPPPRPDKILHKYCHQFLWRRLQYPGRMKSKGYVNFFLGGGGGRGTNKVYYGRCHKAIYSDFLLQKMNLGSITKLKAPVAETKCKMQCRQGFLALPTGRDFIPGRCLPRLSSSLWI